MKHFLAAVLLIANLLTPAIPVGQRSTLFGQNASSGPPAPSVVQAGNCVSGANSCTITLTNTGGNHLFVGIYSTAPATITIADSQTNTYSTVNANISLSPTAGQTFEAHNIANGSNTITCTTTNNGLTMGCVAVEFASSILTSGLDQIAAQANASGTAPTSGASPATTQANEIVFGFVGTQSSPTITAGSGYTIPANGFSGPFHGAVEYKIVAATGVQTADFAFNSAGVATVQLATFHQ